VAAHPRVTIRISLVPNTPSEIDKVVAQVHAAMVGGNLPDLLPGWGGGSLAAQVKAGLLKDITADVSPWKDELNAVALDMYAYQGRQYGVPWNLGLVGFWYNRALFARAGIDTTPSTWDQFLADVGKLKAAKIVPYALGERDGWPGLHLWTYLVLREGGADALRQMLSSGDWNTEACVAGGRDIEELAALDPFQSGFMEAPYAAFGASEAASMGNGEAAMELMGPWAESIQEVNSSDGRGIGDDLGWFSFPLVSGGKGLASEGVGGSDGIVVGRDAPPEAIDFLHFLVGKETASKVGAAGLGLPATIGTSASVTDPLLQEVLAVRDEEDFIQIYLDQADTQAMNTTMKDITSSLFDGRATPEQVCQQLTQAAAAR
jgi:raffinose/stachyose/melibiose transport system substrate-binding protein